MGWSDWGNAAGNLGLDWLGTWMQDRFNTHNRHDAQDWETNMFRNRYQMQVDDLRKAGLNPMLAYMTGPGSTPSSSAAPTSKPDFANTVIQSRVASAQIANVHADTVKKTAEASNIDTDTLVKGGMIDQIAALTSSALASAEQSKAMADMFQATIPKIEMEISKMKVEMDKDKSNIELNKSLVIANQYLNSLRMAEAKLRGQEIILQEPKVSVYQKASDRDKQFMGRMSTVADIMQDFWRMLNPFKGGK